MKKKKMSCISWAFLIKVNPEMNFGRRKFIKYYFHLLSSVDTAADGISTKTWQYHQLSSCWIGEANYKLLLNFPVYKIKKLKNYHVLGYSVFDEGKFRIIPYMKKNILRCTNLLSQIYFQFFVDFFLYICYINNIIETKVNNTLRSIFLKTRTIIHTTTGCVSLM